MVSKFIHTKAFKWLIALIIITIFLVSYAASGKEYIKDTKVHGEALSEKERVDYENIVVTYEKGMPEDILEQCRAAIENMPPVAIHRFITDDWKIAVSSKITIPKDTNINVKTDNTSTAIGITDYKNKTITVLCNDEQQTVTIPLAHELCHYCDKFYGEEYFHDPRFYKEPQEVHLVSFTEAFLDLYEQFKGDYVEFEKYGIEETEENRLDFEYPVSNQVEFFACAYKDYLMHPEYIKDNYRELYTFFSLMQEGNVSALEGKP